jgi:hypothetical protein
LHDLGAAAAVNCCQYVTAYFEGSTPSTPYLLSKKAFNNKGLGPAAPCRLTYCFCSVFYRLTAQRESLYKKLTKEKTMLGFTGMGLVILQMAMLSNGVDSRIVMSTGLFAAVIWVYYALCRKDKWLLLTNVSVGGFAMWGLL